MSGENMILSWGSYNWKVKCTRIIYGPNIVSSQDSGQGGAHNGGYGSKAIYVRQYFLSTVGITVIQSTWEDREAFVGWCIGYGQFISARGGFPVPMRIRGPRKFDYYGVLTSGFDRNNTVQDLAYEMNLTFRGSQPTVGGKALFGSGTQIPKPPTSIGGANSQFYPFEILQSGTPTAEKALYNAPLNDTGGFPGAVPPTVSVPTQNITPPPTPSPVSTSIPGHPGKGEAI